MVIDRSAVILAVLVSAAVLLVVLGSVVPLGGVTVAEFSNWPVVPLGTVPVRVKVALVPLIRSTVVEMSPLPLVVAQLLGKGVLQVQVKPAPVRAAGSGSLTVAPVTSLGPSFVTTMV